MTPTLTIDRRYKGVGRINIRCGTRLPAVKRKLQKMLTSLADEGRVDLLRAVRDGQIHILALHDAYQRKALDTLPNADTAKPLAATMKAWIATLPETKHAASLETSRRYLERERPAALVSDLPDVLDALRKTLGRRHPRSFNILRSAASGFVRQTLRRSHPLYTRVLAVELVSAKAQRKHKPMTMDDLRKLFPHPDTDHVDAIAWGMSLTGMGAAEYWGRWNLQSDRIHIDGTKRSARVRDIPLIWVPVPPRMHRRTFEDKFRDRAGRLRTVYDCRRTYANILEAAGIIRTRRKLYLGHAAGDVTGGYELHEVAEFLAEDAAKLRTFIRMDRVPAMLTLQSGA